MKDICIYYGKEKEGEYDDLVDDDFIKEEEDFEFICYDCSKKEIKKLDERLKLSKNLFK